jgi:hypothetical protein
MGKEKRLIEWETIPGWCCSYNCVTGECEDEDVQACSCALGDDPICHSELCPIWEALKGLE